MSKILIAVAFSAALLALPASAQPYAGAGLGTVHTDSYNMSYKLFVGYQIIPNFGVEIAYNDFGSYRGASANSLSFAVAGTLPLDEIWSLVGQLGTSANSTKFAGTATHSSTLMGLGVGYSYSPNLNVRVEYENYGKLPSDANGVTSQISSWMLNGKYSF